MYCSSIVLCQDGDVRLVGGSTSNQGRVEVCMDETWGTVCHDYWSSIDASVVCKQLGYSRLSKYRKLLPRIKIAEKPTTIIGSSVYTWAYFGQGSGPILLDDVACTGSENRLVDCPYDTYTSDCGHSQDAGVYCRIQCKFQ